MSAAGRVSSKHLFHQLGPLTGQYDEEVAADLAARGPLLGPMMAKLGAAAAAAVDDGGLAYATEMREVCDMMFAPMGQMPYFMEMEARCHQEQLRVPATETNTAEVAVLVHRPKRLEGASPAVVYVHGGGVVAGRADHFSGHCSNLAETCGVIFFNVDYRLAPEAKCPENIKDFYSVLKYVIDNASSLGVDPARVAIMGESGGGYLTAGLCVMLAQKDEAHLVKLAVPVIPMVDDYAWNDPKSMTKEEGEGVGMQQVVWGCIATDIQAQRACSDPLLFPAKAPEALLKKFPPTVVFEVEFDFYLTEATRFARRLNAAGRLLELVVVPGLGHGHAHDPKFKKFHEMNEIMKQLMKEYLVE